MRYVGNRTTRANYWCIPPCSPFIKNVFGGSYHQLARCFLVWLIFGPEGGVSSCLDYPALYPWRWQLSVICYFKITAALLVSRLREYRFNVRLTKGVTRKSDWIKSTALCRPRVEAGKNTSTVIPASRMRRRKGNPVVSGETVPADLWEGYEDLFLDKPLHAIQDHSKLAYGI
jgi:hypothetical protein